MNLAKVGRRIVESGTLTEVRKKKFNRKRTVMLHLFNDMIVISKIQDDKRGQLVRSLPSALLCSLD